jgi:hypothetical protein
MGLMNPRNAVAPLTNKVHIMTIVLLTFLFTVLRLSGGTISIDKKPGRAVQPKEAVTSEPVNQAAAKSTTDEEHFRAIFGQKTEPVGLGQNPKQAAANKPANVPSKPKRKKSALDDIEQALGMK